MEVKFGGTLNILSSKIKKADFKFENLLENILCDKLHIKFLKYISKMGKKIMQYCCYK